MSLPVAARILPTPDHDTESRLRYASALVDLCRRWLGSHTSPSGTGRAVPESGAARTLAQHGKRATVFVDSSTALPGQAFVGTKDFGGGSTESGASPSRSQLTLWAAWRSLPGLPGGGSGKARWGDAAERWGTPSRSQLTLWTAWRPLSGSPVVVGGSGGGRAIKRRDVA